MVQVALVGLGDGHSAELAPNDHLYGIHDGDAEDENRDDEGEGGGGFDGSHNAETGKHEAKDVGSTGSHDDLGRIVVVAKETDAGSGDGGGDNGDSGLALVDGDGHESSGGDSGDSGGEAVYTIDGVHRFGDNENVDRGEGDRGPGQRNVAIGEGDADGLDVDLAQVSREVLNGDSGGEQDQELDLGGVLVKVVENSGDHQSEADDDHSDEIERILGRFGIGKGQDREDGDGNSHIDRDSSPSRKRLFVDSAVVSFGIVHCAVFEGEHSHQWG